jgi:hypothetical protein
MFDIEISEVYSFNREVPEHGRHPRNKGESKSKRRMAIYEVAKNP